MYSTYFELISSVADLDSDTDWIRIQVGYSMAGVLGLSDPYPSINKQKNKNRDFYIFVTLNNLLSISNKQNTLKIFMQKFFSQLAKLKILEIESK
jgi:hypothetical protein